MICRVWKEVFSSQSIMEHPQKHPLCPTMTSPLPKTYDQSPNSPWPKVHTSFWKGWVSGVSQYLKSLRQHGESCWDLTVSSHRDTFKEKGMDQWDQAQRRDGKAARGLEGLNPRLRLISILLSQGPVGCLGTAQEYQKSLGERGWMAERCAILWPFFFKLLFGLF